MILEHDRRSQNDRRELDIGASRDQDERRSVPERRTPIVEEVEFDDIIEVFPIGFHYHPAAGVPRGQGD